MSQCVIVCGFVLDCLEALRLSTMYVCVIIVCIHVIIF